MPAHQRLWPDNQHCREDRREPAIELDKEQAVAVVEPDATPHSSLQHNQLKYKGFTGTLYAAYSDVYEDGCLEMRNQDNEWGNVRRLLLPESRAHRKVQLSPPILPTLPSHGENRGSSPLGSANDFNCLVDLLGFVSNRCPIYRHVHGRTREHNWL